MTSEQLEFDPISGPIPNRGLLQADINMFGLTYLQPSIPDVSIKPFTIGKPAATIDFPEQALTRPSQFRTSGAGLTGITQQMVNNPNSILRSAIAGRHIQATTTLHVSTSDAPLPGGGTANTAFLKGAAQGPNAVAARATATFWLETLQGDPGPPSAAVLADRAAELQRPELASRHDRHAAQAGRQVMR